MQWMLSYPLWTVFPVALLAALATYLLYRRPAGDDFQSSWVRYLLPLLRFLSLFLIGLLLLEPLIHYLSSEEEEPVILVIEDNSSSVKDAWNGRELDVFLTERQKTHQELDKNFKTYYYSFGAEPKASASGDSLSFSEKITDISRAIEAVLPMHSGSNVAAIVLSSDGLFNAGVSPLYSAQARQFPVYTIALGDTSRKKDLLIRQVRYNDLVYLGDVFTVVADIAAYRADGARSSLMLSNSSGQVLQSYPVEFIGDEWSKSFEFTLSANTPGNARYTLSLTSIQGETTTQNNVASIYINVIDGRQKVLVLYDAPHADVRLLRDVLEENKNLESNVVRWQDWKGSVAIYDLVIWHGLPSVRDRSRMNELVLMTQQSKANWFITTTNSDLVTLNKVQDLVNFEVSNKTPNEILARNAETFKKFSVGSGSIQWLEEAPPLVAPYGNHKILETAEVIWYQNIGKVATNFPLLVASTGNRKQALLAGEGLWRWAMQEQLRYQHRNATTEWIDRLVQYIAVKSDQRPFRLRAAKDVFREGEPVALDAALFNASFQLVNEPDVFLEVKDDAGKEYRYVFDKTENAYALNAGALPPGIYTASAKTRYANKDYQASVRFNVKDIMLEARQTTADHQLLNSLSELTGARMLSHREMSLLPQILMDDERIRPVISELRTSKMLLDFRWFLVVLALILSLEWFLRRYFGSY